MNDKRARFERWYSTDPYEWRADIGVPLLLPKEDPASSLYPDGILAFGDLSLEIRLVYTLCWYVGINYGLAWTKVYDSGACETGPMSLDAARDLAVTEARRWAMQTNHPAHIASINRLAANEKMRRAARGLEAVDTAAIEARKLPREDFRLFHALPVGEKATELLRLCKEKMALRVVTEPQL